MVNRNVLYVCCGRRRNTYALPMDALHPHTAVFSGRWKRREPGGGGVWEKTFFAFRDASILTGFFHSPDLAFIYPPSGGGVLINGQRSCSLLMKHSASYISSLSMYGGDLWFVI